MGIDACIYFMVKDDLYPSFCGSLPHGACIEEIGDIEHKFATHKIEQMWRYYEPGYERGPWPLIAAVLMTLHASEDVETVWYFGDCCTGEQEPFSPERVVEFSRHYIEYGNRPYVNAIKYPKICQGE